MVDIYFFISARLNGSGRNGQLTLYGARWEINVAGAIFIGNSPRGVFVLLMVPWLLIKGSTIESESLFAALGVERSFREIVMLIQQNKSNRHGKQGWLIERACRLVVVRHHHLTVEKQHQRHVLWCAVTTES